MIFSSVSGAVYYVYGAAYGGHKASMNKMAADMAIDLKDHSVAALSIWMGVLLTDRLKMVIASDPEKYGHLEGCTETPEFAGHVIWALYNEPELMAISGKMVIDAEMAVRYGIRDANGQQPLSCRDTHKVAPHIQCPNIIR